MGTAWRQERKYMVSRETALALQSSLELILRRDPFCRPDGEYTVRSQYYDSLFDRELQDNLDGLLEKRKLRIRIYDTDSDRARLEYKCRSGSRGIKKVIPIGRGQAEAMERGDFSFLAETGREPELFLYQRLMQGIYRPKVIVEYERRAYTYPAGNTRVTFDRDIRTAVTQQGIFSEDLSFVPSADPEFIVMEVKFRDALPEPVRELLEKHGLRETAHSKYALARQHMR